MNTETLRSILRTHIASVPDLPLMQYEGRAYTRPSVSYLDEELRGGTMANRSNGTTIARSLYLLTLNTAPSVITDDIDRVVDRLGNAFEPGRTMTDRARSHFVEIVNFDGGALRVMQDTWGYRRIVIGLSTIAFRTSLLTG